MFGDQMKKDNFFNEKEEEAQSAREPQEKQVEDNGQLDPKGPDGEPEGQAPENSQTPDTGQVQEEEQTEKPVSSEGTQTPEDNLIAGKFKTRQDMIKSLDHIGKKLGKGTIDQSVVANMSNDELATVYKEHESELGKPDRQKTEEPEEPKEVNQENQELKKELEEVKSYATKLGRYVQQLTNQQKQQLNQTGQSPANQQKGQLPRDNQGRFVSQNNQQQQPQPQQKQQSQQQPQQNNQETQQQEQIDPDQFLSDFYKNPVEAVQKVVSMNDKQRQYLKENMTNQQQQQVNQAVMQEYGNDQYEQQRQQQDPYHQAKIRASQRESQLIKQKASEWSKNNPDVGENVKKEMVNIIREKPIYGRASFFPDGSNIDYVHKLAKQRIAKRNVDSNKQESQQQSQENMEAQKEAARIGYNSTVRNKDGQANDQDFVRKGVNNLFKKKKSPFG